MNNKKRCMSYSSSSDEDIPLIQTNIIKKRNITNKELCRKSIEKCDICDKTFYNKYDLFIHNTTHIIIPLFHQDFYQCAECNSYCITKESLENHSYNKHLYIINPSNYRPKCFKTIAEERSCEINNKDNVMIKHNNSLSILENLVTKEPITVLVKEPFLFKNKPDSNVKEEEKNILNDIVTKQAITVLTKEVFFDNASNKVTDSMAVLIPISKNKQEKNVHITKDSVKKGVRSDVILSSDVIDISDDSCDMESVRSSKSCHREQIEEKKPRCRILFEEDYDDDDDNDGIGLLKEIRSDLVVEPKSFMENIKVTNNSKQNTIILGQYPVGIKFKSVHYDRLTENIVHRCRKCSKTFENRYKLIIHETSHLKFKRRSPFLCKICDWYVASDPWTMRYHQQKKHPDKEVPKGHICKVCEKCQLRYANLYRHKKNYHPHDPEHNDIESSATSAIDESISKRNNDSTREKDDSAIEKADSWGIRTVHVCELCYSFFKNRMNIRYTFLSDVNRTDDRLQCERCFKLFFQLKHVKIEVKRREKRDISNKKANSNKDRLKMVQQRLKKLKLLNKF
ncbi:hypothetical protein ACJJTC_002641 [Scirpophaga incertulas]